MNKKHFLVLLVAAVLLLSACTPQGEPAKSAAVDPIRDISLFDDDAEKIEALLGTADRPVSYHNSNSSKLIYEHFSFLGRDVRLEFNIFNDYTENELVITYYYERDISEGEFKPSAEQLRVAQDFKNEVIELLTSRYGEPIWKSDDGIELVWVKERRMDSAECIKLERGNVDTARAFSLYCWFV